MNDDPGSDGRGRLTKSHDRRLGGVAGGIADYFDLDPTLVRVLFVIGLFLPGLGLGVVLAYFLMWIIIPEPGGAPPPRSTASRGGGPDATMILGIVIVAIGVLLLLRSSWVWTTWFGWAGAALVWPAVLIGIGLFVIYSARTRA